MSSLIGSALKKQYSLRELAGSGGMADVYLAWDNLRSVKVAVKVLRRELAEDKNFYRAFEKEAQFLQELQHPYIVRLYEFGRDGENVFIVMAWVDGINLKKRIEDLGQPLSLVETSRILQPISIALNFAHLKEAFHCDVKPANILLHENGREAFLADFGVARVAHEQAGGGTLPFMAPELFSLNQVNERTDIYALGITTYQMLSGGILPYRGEANIPGADINQRYEWEHRFLPLPPLHQFNPDVNAGIEAVVQQALSKSPAERFASTLEFYSAFEQARLEARTTPLVKIPVEAPKPQPAQSPPPTEERPVPQLERDNPYLYVRSGELAGQSIPIPSQTGLTIGRSATCQIHLREQSVSRVHATVYSTKRGVYIRDEGSSLGTYLNNQRLRPNVPKPLRNGDIIQTGYYQTFEARLK